jgi:hypothetical protein
MDFIIANGTVINVAASGQRKYRDRKQRILEKIYIW